MEDLAGAAGRVTGCPEVLHQGDGIRELLPQPLPIPVNTGSEGSHPRQEADAGRIAERRRAVGARKGNPTLGETVDVGRLRIRVAAQMPDPVAQVVNRDEQHVGTSPQVARKKEK